MRFHIPGIPHTVTNKTWLSCAYTQKVHKLCGMLTRLGHEVYHYGCEGSDPVCTEHVSVISDEYRQSFYPDGWQTRQFSFDVADGLHAAFYRACAEAVRARLGPRDFLLCAWGWGHEPIARMLGEQVMVVESGIGYADTFARFRVFESYTWMAFVYGQSKQVDGSWYDCVIPNFFEPDDFDYREQKEDWFLYLGRVVQRKGVDVAVQVTREINAKLIVAGQGSLVDMNITDAHVNHVGFADVEKRKDLLARAKAVFMPTFYNEPFGGVSIEAGLSGTPVIATDWGVFAENVLHGVTGYRCRTMDHFCWAAQHVERISPAACRAWAMNFSVDRVAVTYEEYFGMLHDLWSEGWYEKRPGRQNLDWLNRVYPSGRNGGLNQTQCDVLDDLKDGAAPRARGQVTVRRLPLKVAFWTHRDWAFGRISQELQLHLRPEIETTLFDWNTILDKDAFEAFDLIYIPLWHAFLSFQQLYPSVPKHKVVCGIHGHAELVNHGCAENRQLPVNEAIVEALDVPSEVVAIIRSFAAVGAVSKQLHSLLRDRYALSGLRLTPCGVDTRVFCPGPIRSDDALRVVVTLARPGNAEIAHGYDVKRSWIAAAAEKRLQQTDSAIRFLFADHRLTLEEMPEFYRQGDVHVCVSHTEGGPLTCLESAACGLAQISTPVGVMPEIVEPGETGFLLRKTEPDEIIDELCSHLQYLNENRHVLRRMQENIAARMGTEWDWRVRADAWKDLFLSQ